MGKNVAVDLITFGRRRLEELPVVPGAAVFVACFGPAMARMANTKAPVGVPRVALALLDPNLSKNDKKSIYYHYFVRYKLLLVAVYGFLPARCAARDNPYCVCIVRKKLGHITSEC